MAPSTSCREIWRANQWKQRQASKEQDLEEDRKKDREKAKTIRQDQSASRYRRRHNPGKPRHNQTYLTPESSESQASWPARELHPTQTETTCPMETGKSPEGIQREGQQKETSARRRKKERKEERKTSQSDERTPRADGRERPHKKKQRRTCHPKNKARTHEFDQRAELKTRDQKKNRDQELDSESCYNK